MEVIVKQEHLTKALNILSKIANGGRNNNSPILKNILMRTGGSQLFLASTDLEIAISQNIGAKVDKVGEITVPARLFSEFISALPKGNVSLKTDGDHILVESENYKSKINGISTEDFPEIPVIDENLAVRISMSTDDFMRSYSQVAPTVSKDTSRPILTGVFWHTFEGSLYLAATDGYRLSEKRLFETEEEISAIIPNTTLSEVAAAAKDSGDGNGIEITFDDVHVEFLVGDKRIISKRIDGKYVDYRRLIPSSTETEAIISKDDFSRAVKVASLFARESGGSVRLEASEESGKLSIQSIASEFGENTSEADAQITGGGEVSLNPAYLTDALRAVQGSQISYGFSGKLAPTVMKSPDHDDYTHIIMPVKS